MARRSRQLGHNTDEPLGSHVDVMVLIDYETLTEGSHDESTCELDDTTPLSPAAARRLLCDADVLTAIRHRTPFALDLGYSRRAANRKIRKALIARDRTCVAPGCERPHWMCEIHHIVPWAEGGRTDLDNLTLLCGRHHHIHHAEEARKTARARRAAGKCKASNTSDPPPGARAGPRESDRQPASDFPAAPPDQPGTGERPPPRYQPPNGTLHQPNRRHTPCPIDVSPAAGGTT